MQCSPHHAKMIALFSLSLYNYIVGRLISLIYFFIISTIGLILLIIGLYNAVSLGVNLTQYDKYPLNFSGQGSCDSFSTVSPMTSSDSVIEAVPIKVANEKENARQKALCEERIVQERKQHQVDDTKNAIYFTLIGVILLAIHLPIAVRRSREDKK